MNVFRVRHAFWLLLNHPEQLTSGARADLLLALHSDNPFDQGQVAELLRAGTTTRLDELGE